MKKFIVLYNAPAEAMEQSANTSPEDQAKGMEAWAQWAERCGESLVDMGAPLMMGHTFTSNGRSESKSHVSGYSILGAESIEDAAALLNEHPHLASHPEATIELHEEMPMPATM